MNVYIIVENEGEWSAAHIENPALNSFIAGSAIWFDRAPMSLQVNGLTADHAHQLEKLEEAVEHCKRWIARDAQKRLGGKP